MVAALGAFETNMSAGGSPFRHSPVTIVTALQRRNFTVAFTERFYAIVSKTMTFSPYDSVLSVARCLSDDFQQGREAASLSLMYILVQAGVHSDVDAAACIQTLTRRRAFRR